MTSSARLRLSALVTLLCLAPTLALGQDKAEKKTIEAKKKTEKKKAEDTLHVTGTIGPGDPTGAAPRVSGSHYKVHTCKLLAGTRYVIDLIGDGSGMDPYLVLQDDRGTVLQENDDNGASLNSRIEFMAPRTAEYKVFATTLGAGQFGTYQLDVQPLAAGESVPPPPSHTLGSGTPGTPARPGAPYTAPVTYDDIAITPQTLILHTGSASEETHGYVEYRFLVENNSETASHRVNLTMPPWRGSGMGPYISALRRTVEVGPRASIPVSLWQPDLPMHSTGAVVTIDGVRQDNVVGTPAVSVRGQRFNRFGVHRGGTTGAWVNVLAPTDLIQSMQSNIFKSAVGRPPRPAPGVSSSGGMYKGKNYQYQHIHQFHHAAQPLKAWSKHWLSYSSFDAVVVPGEQFRIAPPEVQAALWQYVECGGALLLIGPCPLPESWEQRKETGPGLTTYYPGFGACLVAPADIKTWEPEQWLPIVTAWEQAVQPWSQIQTPSAANSALPVVESHGIPVRGMFALMLAFSILIGPVNLYVLHRLKRRLWLLWTVPAFSLLTCAVVFAFMLLSDGWLGQTRSEGLTFLDENTQRAASIGWLGVYAPVTPGDGLHFSYDTEVTPHLKPNPGTWRMNSMPLTMDWSDDQHLVSGWVSARVPAHFLVRTGTRRLERLVVRQDGKSVSAVNGLKAPIKQLWLADGQGNIHSATNISEGGETALRPTGEQARGEMGALHKVYLGGWLGQAERLRHDPPALLAPGTYLAILDGTPFLEEGLRVVRERQGESVVFGIMKGAGDAR